MRKVPSVGRLDSSIVIVGIAPNKEDDMVGMPFVGSQGTLLRQLLKSAGIDFNDCYVTNLVKYHPPHNDIKRIKELGLSIEKCAVELKEELSHTTANVIIALGEIPLQVLTSKEGIGNYRGSILQSTLLQERKIIPTYHPGSLFHQMSLSALVMSDFKRVFIESKFPDFRSIPKRNFLIRPSYSQTINYLNDILSLDGKEFKKVSFDIETTRINQTILCMGISDNKDSAICVPIFDRGKNYWTFEQEVEIWKLFKAILTSPHHYKIMQNAQFEMDCLFDVVGEITPVYLDTMIGHHLLYSELPKSLDTLCSIYTNEPYYKNEAKEANYKSEVFWTYNCKDVCVTFEVAEAIEKEIAEANLTPFLHGYQMPLLKVLWQSSHFGVKLDKSKVKELNEYYLIEVDKWQKCLNVLAGKEVNVGSSQQVSKLLYQDMKLPQSIHRKTGKITSDNEAIERLNKLHPHPIFESILKNREYKKIVSTYTKDMSDSDGRVRCNWVITGTETGRLSSRKNIRKTGCNLQNIPKHLRDIFVSDDGCSFVVGDLSQVEARFVAWLSNDVNLKNLFKKGGKIHSQVASWIYKTPVDLISPGQYAKAKSVVHGANYDMGYRTFAQTSGISITESQWLLNQYHNNFPMIKMWHQSIIDQLRRNRMTTSPFGRRRLFFGWWGDSLFKEAYATVPQACAVDLLCMAILRVYYQLPPSAIILLQVHDEIVIQCKDEDVNIVASLFKKEVEKPIIVNGDSLIIPLDIKVGKNWKELEEWTWI